MKPSNTERDALARRPVSPDHQRYEAEKRKWSEEHPDATAEQYEAAMKRIAWKCGV